MAGDGWVEAALWHVSFLLPGERKKKDVRGMPGNTGGRGGWKGVGDRDAATGSWADRRIEIKQVFC